MFKFVANHNDEQVIAMFMSNLKRQRQETKGEKQERTVRNSDAPAAQFTFVVESNIIFSYFQAIKITLFHSCICHLSPLTLPVKSKLYQPCRSASAMSEHG